MRQRIISLLIMTVFLTTLLSTGLTVSAQESPLFSLNKNSISITGGEEFTFVVKGHNIENIYACEVLLSFETDKLGFVSANTEIESFKFSKKLGDKVYYVYTLLEEEALTINGDVDLCTFKFKSLPGTKDSSDIILESVVIVEKNDGDTSSNTYTVDKSLTVNIETSSPTTPPTTPPPTTPSPTPGGDDYYEEIVKIIDDQNRISSEDIDDIAELMKKLLQKFTKNNTTDAARTKNVETLKNAVNSLISAIDKAESEEDKEKLILEVTKALGESAAIGKTIKDEASAIKVVEEISTIMDALAGAIDENDSKELKKSVIQEMKTAVAGVAKLLSSISDSEKAQELGEKVIDSVAAIVSKTVTESNKNKALINKTLDVMETVVEIAGKTQHNTTGSDVVTVNRMTEAMVSDILSKAEAAVEIADSLIKKLSESGLTIDKEIEKKVTIAFDTNENTNQVNVTLPNDVLSGVKEKGVHKIEISSGFVSMKMDPDFVKSHGDLKEIVFNVEKVEIDTSIIEKMSPEQKKLMEYGAELYNFDLKIEKQNGTNQMVTSFDSDIEISVPYTLKAGDDPEKITILYLADSGKIENMIGKYNADTGRVSFSTQHFSKYIATSRNIEFTDVAEDHWAKHFIEVMAAKGIIVGVSDKEYKFLPDNNVTRAEFSKMLTMALGLVDENSTSDFVDVDSNAWYKVFVASANKEGIIQGRPGKIFAPNDFIQRQEMATMISRALKLIEPKDPKAVTDFTDENKIQGYAAGHVAALVETGITVKEAGDEYAPYEKVNRSEAAAMLYMLFNY